MTNIFQKNGWKFPIWNFCQSRNQAVQILALDLCHFFTYSRTHSLCHPKPIPLWYFENFDLTTGYITLLTLTLPLATFLWLKRAALISWHQHTGLNIALQSLQSHYSVDLDLTFGHISLIEESCINFMASAYRSEHCIAIFAIALLCWPWPYLWPHFFDWRELHEFHGISIQVWTLHCSLCHHNTLLTLTLPWATFLWLKRAASVS